MPAAGEDAEYGRHRDRHLPYPVKGLSAEKLDRVTLTRGECLPLDHRFAIALGSTAFDPARPEWLSKTHFIMLMRDEKLAQCGLTSMRKAASWRSWKTARQCSAHG
jgi:uncharacterized protein YcbX